MLGDVWGRGRQYPPPNFHPGWTPYLIFESLDLCLDPLDPPVQLLDVAPGLAQVVPLLPGRRLQLFVLGAPDRGWEWGASPKPTSTPELGGKSWNAMETGGVLR